MAEQKGNPWTRDQLIVVMALYFSLPFGKMHKGNPRIVALAQQLGRTPSSVAMKLTNLAALDPAHQSRGVKGLAGHSALDAQVWREFHENWDEMLITGQERLDALEKQTEVINEVESVRKVRTMQGAFRRVVLAAYSVRCCITGSPVEELLVASHILPWAEFPQERLNPSNGLCLVAHFDRAFDRGLISFDSNLRLLVSPRLRKHAGDAVVEGEFLRRAGKPIETPERFSANLEFLNVHRTRFGFAG